MATLYLVVFLLVFCGSICQIDSACNVSCTTDYISGLNCSCSDSEKTLYCEIYTNCSDSVGFTHASCVIRPPHRWCTIQLDNFFMIANPDTNCILKVKQVDQQTNREVYTSKSVALYQMIKLQQPVNITLIKSDKEFNLSWEMAYTEDENFDLFYCLMYRVRLRPKDIMKQDDIKVYNIREDRRFQEIQCEQLSPGKVYAIEVQAAVNPDMKDNYGELEWSDWSDSVECSCLRLDPEFAGPYDTLWYILMLPVVLGFLAFFGMCYRGVHKKPCLFQYIPDPHDFFKPLYHTYQGDFKKWVGPVFTFSSFDVMEKSAPLQVLSEKQQTGTQRPLLHDQGCGDSCHGDWSLPSFLNPDLSKRYFLGGSSLKLAHSGDHISIDTVTVSGQECAMSETNQKAMEVQDRAEDLELDNRESSGDWQLQGNDTENGEELSLDSFSSNEHSDYGYPQIALDLDTIDSGFLESGCSSPVSSECEGGEGMDTSLLGGTVRTHSNYVKQWVAFIPGSGENSNSL